VSNSTPGYTRWYAANSFWNTPIPANPAIDPDSSAMIATAVVPFTHTLVNDDAWGYPYVYAQSADPSYNVQCTMYCLASSVAWQIPLGATPNTGSDQHLTVIDGTQELDMWLAAYNSGANTWSAGSEYINDMNGWGASCPQGQHCDGAVAAGFAELGGAIRPEEIAQGHIDHAIALATPATRANYIACPATHTDGSTAGNSAIPEGAQLQLDPSFNVAAQSWPTWEKIIAVALQTYGGFIADTSGAFEVRAVTDTNAGNMSWASVGVPKGASLDNLPWSSFQVLQIQSCN
jgi:hypothetical protein